MTDEGCCYSGLGIAYYVSANKISAIVGYACNEWDGGKKSRVELMGV